MKTPTTRIRTASLPTSERPVPAGPQRFAGLLAREFDRKYGAAVKAGFIGRGLVGDLVRGIAFAMAGDQEATDMRAFFLKMESAVAQVLAQVDAR